MYKYVHDMIFFKQPEQLNGFQIDTWDRQWWMDADMLLLLLSLGLTQMQKSTVVFSMEGGVVRHLYFILYLHTI